MSHFAEIDENNIVIQVLECDDFMPYEGYDWLVENLSGTWIKTSYNTAGGVHLDGGTPLRKNYASIGYTYDEGRDAFIPPKPYPSWLLDEDTCQWEAPTLMPTIEMNDPFTYTWNEETTSWLKITFE